MPRIGIPAPVMHQNSGWLLPCFQHPRKILMMVKWIAACPDHHLNVRIVILRAIILKFSTRIQQHIANARNRNK